jgi:hypothetical protein
MSEPPAPEDAVDHPADPICPVCRLPIPAQVSVGMRDGQMLHVACWLLEAPESPAAGDNPDPTA